MPAPSVYYFHSRMRGAPVLQGQTGSLIGVLNACLIDGFGSITADAVSVSGGVATATLPSGIPFDIDANILVAGATPAAVNGVFRPSAQPSGTSVSWAVTAPNGPVTGTVTIRVAPLGWVRPYASTNLAVYKSADPTSYGMYLRVDDTPTNTARLVGYENMSDVDNGTGPFPTSSQVPGGGFWFKASTPNTNPIDWHIVADSRFFIFHAQISQAYDPGPNRANYSTGYVRGFGDQLALAPMGDAFASLLSVGAITSYNSAQGMLDSSYGTYEHAYLPRGQTGIGSSVSMGSVPFIGNTTTSGNDAFLGPFPSPVNGALYLSKRYLRDPTTGTPRAIVPGLHSIPMLNTSSVLSNRDVLAGTGELAGRRMVVLEVSSNPDHQKGSGTGAVLIDITGPWR